MPELHDASLIAIMRHLQTIGCCSVSLVITFCTAVHLPSTMWAAKVTVNYVFPIGGDSVSKLRTVEQYNFLVVG